MIRRPPRSTLFPLHDALPIWMRLVVWRGHVAVAAYRLPIHQTGYRHRPLRVLAAFAGTYQDRKSTRLNSSHGYISYAVFCLKKKNNTTYTVYHHVLRKPNNAI